jgi:hypothetical protein
MSWQGPPYGSGPGQGGDGRQTDQWEPGQATSWPPPPGQGAHAPPYGHGPAGQQWAPGPGLGGPPPPGRRKGGLVALIAVGCVFLLLIGVAVVVAVVRLTDKDETPTAAGSAAPPSTAAQPPTGATGADSGEDTGAGGATGTGAFDVPIGSDGSSDPKDWPDACKMLTDAEIKAIVPQAGKITRKGQHGSFLGGGETPHYVECEHEVPLASDPYPDLPSRINVSIDGVADKAETKSRYELGLTSNRKTEEKFPDQFEDYGDRFGADGCYFAHSGLTCYKGTFLFGVRGRDASDDDFNQVRWREKQLAAVVRTLSAKMR